MKRKGNLREKMRGLPGISSIFAKSFIYLIIKEHKCLSYSSYDQTYFEIAFWRENIKIVSCMQRRNGRYIEDLT